MPKGMLEGYRALDFTQVLAGPTTTRYLAELGAEVVKVEFAPNGDISRGVPMLKDGRSGYYVQQNRGKRSLCVDLKKPAGAAIIREMIPKMDILVENFAPGVIGRLGFDYETVSALNPKIVMCSISTFGQEGPLANRPGYDFIGCAYSGVLSMLGHPDRPPVVPQVGVGDISTGLHGFSAILAALLHRERTGEGQHVEATLLDSYFSYNDLTVQMVSLSGGTRLPRRTGSHHFGGAPLGIFNGKQNSILIMASADHQFPYLCQAMGQPELAQQARFKTIVERIANVEELKGIIQGWIDSMPSDDDIFRLFDEYRIPYAPVLTIEEAMAHPHLRERGTVIRTKDRFLGEFEVPGFPLRFSRHSVNELGEAPTLGEHNAAILSEYLGYSAEKVAALETEGVLRRGPR